MMTGEYILKLSSEKGISQSELARKCGISRQSLSYVVSGERPLTLQQALRVESYFSLECGTLLKMQQEDAVAAYRAKVKSSLFAKLKSANAFWSYSQVKEGDVSDEDLVEKTLIHLDMDDISRLFELFTLKFVRKVWEERMACQGEYMEQLNMMIAQYYFGIRDPEKFLRKKEQENVTKATEYA